MQLSWSATAPIYRQLADRLSRRLLDGDPAEGEALPSVRVLAHQYLLNPLTVGRAVQTLVDEGLVEPRRGVGMYVQPGARDRLRRRERERFLTEEWPSLRSRLQQLGIDAGQLNWDL